MIDNNYFESCLKKIDELKKEKERAEKDKNITEAEVFQHEMDEIWKQLESSKGLGIRIRNFRDESEKARTAVRKAITRSFDRIERENEELWRHLENSIYTGLTCSYKPDQKIDWQL